MEKDEVLQEESFEDNLEEFEKKVDEVSDETTDNLEDALKVLQQEKDKLKDDLLRTLADMENLKKRCVQEIEKNSKYAIADFAKSLLPVADNLQRAIDAVKDCNDKDAVKPLLEGIELTQNELVKAFAKFEVKKMEILDTIFNPNFHQVVQELPNTNKEPGTIVNELQTGYMIGDRILREAMVIVAGK